MDVLILASEECDTAKEIICAPSNVIELFEHKDALFSIGPFDFTRTVFLMFLAMLTVVGMFVSDLLLAALDPRIRLTGGVAQ